MRRGFRIRRGDVLDVLPTLEAESFHACLCDPPYHLTEASRGGSARVFVDNPYGRARVGVDRGFMGTTWDGGDVAFRPATWREVLRVLKPGAPLLAFGGTRTYHRLACAIEDAGFEVRDCLVWIYGSGFPKSLDISKAIDKAAGAERRVVGRRRQHDIRHHAGKWEAYGEGLSASARRKPAAFAELTITAPATREAERWSGYGTALKPAWEPIVLAMKPCDGTFAANALRHGVAGLNIDRARIPVSDRSYARNCSGDRGHSRNRGRVLQFRMGCGRSGPGRWPTNLILDEESAAILDAQTGDLGISTGAACGRHAGGKTTDYGEFGGTGRYGQPTGYGDSGGASRFFYCAKASRAERGTGNSHPTVKPLKLIRYLATLILPPTEGARLLVPFAGSGSELLGARQAGWTASLGIEMQQEYVAIARRRMAA